MYIHVKALTGRKAEKVEKISADHYVISVREEAERNLANTRILEILRELHQGALVRIVNGHHSPSKLISVGSLEVGGE